MQVFRAPEHERQGLLWAASIFCLMWTMQTRQALLGGAALLAAAAQLARADTYHKSPCNVVHWTHMLEGKIIVEGRDPKPIDVEDLFMYEHDLPANHRIIHPFDRESTDRRPDRLTVYVDREGIFLNAFCT
ncbi:hypothetical protein H4R18_003552 [Coemansia javaensis]|uniref:Uncharacterized protein n=1 Tax=Coemansia javaensis TaxID=2761396 RepID=A0A9W8HBQ8_9FUNG|nr:hypothetical protein H4R18_003552 [Coemansia javaensis]